MSFSLFPDDSYDQIYENWGRELTEKGYQCGTRGNSCKNAEIGQGYITSWGEPKIEPMVQRQVRLSCQNAHKYDRPESKAEVQNQSE